MLSDVEDIRVKVLLHVKLQYIKKFGPKVFLWHSKHYGCNAPNLRRVG